MVPEPLRLESNRSRMDLLETKKPDISIYSTKTNPRRCYSITCPWGNRGSEALAKLTKTTKQALKGTAVSS